jgi:dual oxidase
MLKYLHISELGNPRGNENPFLLSFGVLWFRWHNVLAKMLHSKYPKWTDEKIFNEARKWLIATHQQIVVYEWLPAWLGDDLGEYESNAHFIHQIKWSFNKLCS